MSMLLKVSRRITSGSGTLHSTSSISRRPWPKAYSTETNSSPKPSQDESKKLTPKPAEETSKVKKKTQAELAKELELKMQGLAGDGGESGVEFEDGQPVAMKRSVKNNMFRYI